MLLICIPFGLAYNLNKSIFKLSSDSIFIFDKLELHVIIDIFSKFLAYKNNTGYFGSLKKSIVLK